MSAIGGIFRFDGAPVGRDIDRLARGLPKLDGAKPHLWSDGPVALAYRPYVITPEDRLERQPWVGGGGARRLVFTGRIDNRAELAAQLDIPPPALREMADGALILAAFDRWDLEAPARVVGSFAAALWDAREQRLALCRDKMGDRALFFYRAAGFVAFANTFNALFALPDVPRTLDETILADQLANNLFDRHRTFFSAVERVPESSIAVFQPGRFDIREYWAPQRRSLGLRSYEDHLAAARELLDTCVGSALRSATPVAASVSGGLDSGGVAATAARLLAPARLAAFTRIPPPDFPRAETGHLYFDEAPKVAALAAMHPNIDVNLVDDAGLHPIDRNPARFFLAAGIAAGPPTGLAWFASLYDRVAEAGHRVLLNGGLGNFTLGWSGQNLIPQLVRSGRWLAAARAIGAYHRVQGVPVGRIVRQFAVGPLIPDALRRRWRRARDREFEDDDVGFLDPDYAAAQGTGARVREIGRWRPDFYKGDAFAQRVHWILHGRQTARDWIGETVGIWGFERRDPLNDSRMVEFCLNVPEAHYQRHGLRRSFQRDVIADRTPPEIYLNTKKGEQAPEWYDRVKLQREGYIADIERIAASRLASRLIDVKRLRSSLENWPDDAADLGPRRYDVRLGLTRAVHLGRFICWVEGGNE
jgi:asparagine synthase (glutamine-hydrolysing)